VIENALKGQNVQSLLNSAVASIDQAYSQNDDYGIK
jgi:hypothetical protein